MPAADRSQDTPRRTHGAQPESHCPLCGLRLGGDIGRHAVSHMRAPDRCAHASTLLPGGLAPALWEIKLELEAQRVARDTARLARLSGGATLPLSQSVRAHARLPRTEQAHRRPDQAGMIGQELSPHWQPERHPTIRSTGGVRH